MSDLRINSQDLNEYLATARLEYEGEPDTALPPGTHPCGSCSGSFTVERDDAGAALVVADACSSHCPQHGTAGDEHGGDA